MKEEKKLTGYPSIDKPWMKYYSEEAINAPLPKMSMYEYIWEKNKTHLEQIALKYYGANITYQRLFDQIKSAAKAFSTAGVQSGDFVIIASVTLPETIYAIYALNSIGAIPNMVDPRTSVEGIRDYIREVSARFVVVIDAAYPKIVQSIEQTPVERIITLSAFDSMPAHLKLVLKTKSFSFKKADLSTISTMKWRDFIKTGRNKVFSPKDYQPDQCSVIVHTGGTTGMPKSVMVSNDNANAGAHEAMNSPIFMARGDIFLNVIPPFFAFGIILGIHIPLSCGWISDIVPQFDLNRFDELLIKHRPNGMIGVPAYYKKLMESKKLNRADLSFLKCVLAGGDKIPADFEVQVNQFLHNHNANIHLTKGYSMTEASAMATVSYENTIRIGSNGIPLSNTVIAAFEEGTDRELSYGERGEICISSPTVMLGYYHNEAATNEVLYEHSDGNKWLHSGDLGYIDSDGFVFIEGRLKRMFMTYRSIKIFPPFIERVIISNPKVSACCVVGKDDVLHGRGQVPVVFLVLKPSPAEEKDQIITELKLACEQRLPEYSLPESYYFIPALPLTPMGKVDYRALEKMAVEQSSL